MRLVIIESPYSDSQLSKVRDNQIYARAAMRDSLSRGEAPFASHLLYTQVGVLDDYDPQERDLGIRLGYEWGRLASLHAFYTDFGWSPGMLSALQRCRELELDLEFRSLNDHIQLPPNTDRPMEQPK